MQTVRIGVAICVHDDDWFLPDCIRSFESAGPVHVFVSKLPWHGPEGNWERAAQKASVSGAEVILGEWPTEILHRQGALHWMIDHGFSHAFIPDSDEIIEEGLLQSLCSAASIHLAQRFYVEMDTYWKEPDTIIRPRESLRPLLLFELDEVWPDDQHKFSGRLYGGGKGLVFQADHGILHHLSYVGPDERIKRKISTWSHHDEVVPNWWENVWLGWNQNPLLRNLHPTHPPVYSFAEQVPCPKLLNGVLSHRPTRSELSSDCSWPTVSVIIPLFGNTSDIRRCLESLEANRDLVHEVIVIDNASPDAAASVTSEFSFVTLVRNKTNLGFGQASNQGAAQASGDVLLFLNSDTIVPRSGLMRLIEALERSGSIGAAGPLTNRSGHHQQIDPTYTTRQSIGFFADAFARMSASDREVDMLVGFCLAVRRSVFVEIGEFDPRFGLGLFEDNDLCYRIRRAGYKLVIAARSFVHHEGSRSLLKLPDPASLFKRNLALYQEKWKADVESGFADGLSGIGPADRGGEPSRIRFDVALKPEGLLEVAVEKAKRARISLCMIVRDEERVLGSCLESAHPFFFEMIVVDTGSKDKTKAIANQYGAKVIDYPWTDSFSDARNVSLQNAAGDWILWLDADDTVPLRTGEAIQNAVLTARKGMVGFVLPVQFVDEGPAGGTRVDHLKLFRNLPGLEFELRIHEQIIGSLRKHPGEIGRIDAPILHSGYDTSPEGQARKRIRDQKLLELDLKEHPMHPFVLFNLGMTEHHLGNHSEAISWLDKSLDASQPGESHRRKAYALKALSQRAGGRLPEACQTIVDGLKEVGEDPELRFQYGLILSEMGQYRESLEQYLAMSVPDPNCFHSFDVGVLTFKRDHNIATVYLALGDFKSAAAHWRKALVTAPSFLHSAFGLFDAALDQGDYSTAKEAMEHVHLVSGWSENWAEMLVRFEERWHGAGAVIQRLCDVVEQRPFELAPRLVLARRLLAANQISRARPELEMLASAGVAEAAYCLGVTDVRAGRMAEALTWMERALDLDPTHEATRNQVEALRRALS